MMQVLQHSRKGHSSGRLERMETYREYMGKAVEVVKPLGVRLRPLGVLVGVLLLEHMVHWVVGWVYYNYCVRSFFMSLITNGSYVCTALDAVQRSSMTRYSAAVAGLIRWG